MESVSERKLVLIHRETRLEALIRRHNTSAQAEFFIQSRGDSFSEYLDEHRELKQALQQIETTLRGLGRVQRLERSFLPNFIFGPDDLVIVSGQDGLVANTLKYLNGQPLIAINPAPARFDGQLLPFKQRDVKTVITKVLQNRFACKLVTMAQAQLNDGQSILAVNDLYIGPKLPISARYQLEYAGQHEEQSSSGVLVSTGLGSTGWLHSLITGALAINTTTATTDLIGYPLPWDSPELCFCVREPFPSQTTGTSLVFGRIQPAQGFALTSRMAEGGIIFSDGIVEDAIEFNSGTKVQIGIAGQQGRLVAR